MALTTILWREFRFFRRRIFKITTAQAVTPLLYLLTFGLGLNGITQEGYSYLFFLLPGLLAMTTTRNGYTSVSMRVSVCRLHERSFECYLYAPMRLYSLTLGYILTGVFRGLYAGIFVIMLSFLVGGYDYQVMLFSVLVLNSFIFASLGFIASVTIDTHYDLNRFTNMVITPMTFLCGTFYSVSGLPRVLKWLIELLPLTHSTRLIRRLMFGRGIDGYSLVMLVFYCLLLLVISLHVCKGEIDQA